MPTSEYTPSTADVGALVRARTVDAGGNEVGDFTADTRPTGDEVDVLIAEAIDEVASAVGPDVPDGPDPDDKDTLRRMAKRVTSLYAAANVELSYFPEQAGQNNSVYDKLLARARSTKETLVEAVAEVGGGGDGQSVGGAGPMASYGFPVESGWDEAAW